MVNLIPMLAGGFLDWIKDRRELAHEKREHDRQIEKARVEAKIQRIREGDAHAAELDRISLESRGWKDDILLYLIITPCVAAFIPDARPWVDDGFASLASLPDWYLIGLLLVFVDTFGFRRLLRASLEGYIKRKL